MTIELLDLDIVNLKMKLRYLNKGDVKSSLGLGTTAATLLFAHGILPKNEKRKKAVLDRLAKVLGVQKSVLTCYYRKVPGYDPKAN